MQYRITLDDCRVQTTLGCLDSLQFSIPQNLSLFQHGCDIGWLVGLPNQCITRLASGTVEGPEIRDPIELMVRNSAADPRRHDGTLSLRSHHSELVQWRIDQ